MATLKQVLARLRALVRGADLDRDFAEEMQAHLEMATETDNWQRIASVIARLLRTAEQP